MALYDVPAPAKINLFLHVTGRRPDGYHTLQTVFRYIELYDWLDFDLRQDGRIVRDPATEGATAPEQDLVLRAAALLQSATGARQGAQIGYRKQIPAGGGLGGGSSDAATTLIALNRLWRTGLSRGELQRLALQLGADVPVFIFGQPAFAEGVGEILSPVGLPPRAYLVLQPPQSMATAAVFQSPDLTRDTKSIKIADFSSWQENAGQQQNPGYFGRNDLQPVVVGANPSVARMAAWLASTGWPARMTGSGACFFVEFATEAQAEMSKRQIPARIAVFAGQENDAGSAGAAAVVQKAWSCAGLFDHPLRSWISG